MKGNNNPTGNVNVLLQHAKVGVTFEISRVFWRGVR